MTLKYHLTTRKGGVCDMFDVLARLSPCALCNATPCIKDYRIGPVINHRPSAQVVCGNPMCGLNAQQSRLFVESFDSEEGRRSIDKAVDNWNELALIIRRGQLLDESMMAAPSQRKGGRL